MAFQVKSLAWLGTRTEKFDELTRFYRDILKLTPVASDEGYALFRLPSGDMVEAFAHDEESRGFFTTGPVAGFEVEDVAAARAELEQAGIEFIGEIHSASDGGLWSHFRAPDGNIYEITQLGSS